MPAKGCTAASSSVAGASGKRPDLFGVVEVVVPDRVAPGRVGPDERGMDEERLVTVLLQPPRHGLAHVPRLGELRRETCRRPRGAVIFGPGESLDRLVERVGIARHVEAEVGQPLSPTRAALLPGVVEHGAEAGKDTFVGREPRVTRRHRPRVGRRVRVPEEDGVIAQLPGQERDIGEAGIERGAVLYRTIAMLVRAGVQAGAGGSARCGIGPVVGEQHSSSGQGIQCRRLEDRMAESGQTVPPPLVNRDEQHVAAWAHASLLPISTPRGNTPRSQEIRRGAAARQRSGKPTTRPTVSATPPAPASGVPASGVPALGAPTSGPSSSDMSSSGLSAAACDIATSCATGSPSSAC